MAQQVVHGATLSCSFGTTPSTFTVLPKNRSKAVSQAAATIMDNLPNVNVMPFGLCQTPTNPQVAAATAAALGTLTPQPCIPVTPSPWTPGSPTVKIAGIPALNNNCKLMCAWQGVISVSNAGQMTVNIP